MNTSFKYYKDLIKKHFMLFVTVFLSIFSIFIVYAYFAQRVYQSEATVEIIKYKQDIAAQKDAFQIAVKENSPNDESEILKSNFLVNKAIDEIDFKYEYFNLTKAKLFVIDEEEFPFVLKTFKIKNKKLFNQKINIVQIDNEYFRISFDTSTLMSSIKGSSDDISLDEKYKYNTLIQNDFFDLEVIKKEGR